MKQNNTLNNILKKRSLRKIALANQLSARDMRNYLSKRPKKRIYGSTQYGLVEDLSRYRHDIGVNNKLLVIDLGSYNRRIYEDSINVDIVQAGDTDLVWDITKKLPIRSGTVDFIACSAVLEHVNEPSMVIKEMYRILKPRGRVWVDIPFLQPYHESPDDFYRFTLSGIKHMFKRFILLKSGATPGAGFTVGWILREFKAVLEWEGLLNKRKYPRIAKLLEKENLDGLERQLVKFDNDCQLKFGDDLPHSFHITATGVFVYAEKPQSLSPSHLSRATKKLARKLSKLVSQ